MMSWKSCENFDPATQRSLDKVEQLVLTPTSFNPIIAQQIQQNQQDISNYLSPEEIELWEIGNYPEGMQRFLGIAF